jgi:5-methylcytosine-specific restriction endonuclease McrA
VKKLLRGLIFLVIAIAMLSSGVPLALVIIAVLVWRFFRRRQRSRATESTGQATPRSHIPASVEWRVIKEAKGRCVDCGHTAEDGLKMHIDHKVPLYKGGTNDFKNLCLRCEKHNLGKGTDDDYQT